jgi:radical SAM protein with 4Fe4S-binding SPASM domain
MTRLTPRPTPQPLAGDESGTLLPRHDPIERLPVLILFPHNRCNCRCVMCDIWRIRDRQELAPEEIAHWLVEWRELGVRRVVLSGGEALLHRRLWEIATALRDAGIGITLLSTGLLLRRHAENVVRLCDDVVVSLDGPREIHDEIRRIPDAFGKLHDGVAAIRAADPARTVRISARCVVQQANCRHLRATVAAAHELDLDSLSFLAVDISTTAFNRPGGWEAERGAVTAPAAEDLPALLHELECLERESAHDFDSGFLAESPLKLRRRLYQHFNAVLGNGEFHPVSCNAPWVSSVIESDGTVRPCFFQPALGNIHESGSLTQILNSPDAIAWRQGLDTRRDEICRRCVCSLALRDGADVPQGL